MDESDRCGKYEKGFNLLIAAFDKRGLHVKCHVKAFGNIYFVFVFWGYVTDKLPRLLVFWVVGQLWIFRYYFQNQVSNKEDE